MGIVDYERLHKIYQEAKKICKENNLNFHFKIDSGNFETALEFTAIGYNHPPRSKNWDEVKKEGNTILCPDLLDFEHRIIIEMEEESKPGKKSGKLGRKGHTEESSRDTNRDQLYRIGGFKLCKVWESEFKSGEYKHKLYEFLKSSLLK